MGLGLSELERDLKCHLVMRRLRPERAKTLHLDHWTTIALFTVRLKLGPARLS